MPAPPPPPEDLSALAAQYDHPTGELPLEQVAPLVAEGLRRAELGETLSRLDFLRRAVSETSAGLGFNTNAIELLFQGRIDATVQCPSDGSLPTSDANSNGEVRLTFGVEDSFLQRGFEGAAVECRFRVSLPSAPDVRVLLSANITGDLGADLPIGNISPVHMLLKLSNVSGVAASAGGTVDLPRSDFHFRITRDGALEILFDPTSIGLPDFGSVVFAVRPDGSFALRERRGEWVCGGGGAVCVLR